MPFRRRRTFRRRTRAPWYRRKYTALQLAAKAARGVYNLRGLVNSEKKYATLSANANPDNSTGSVIHLTQTAQGDDNVDDRNGNSIFVRSILFRAICVKHATPANTHLRIIMFIDNQQISDTAPALSDILESSSTISPLSTGTAGRFKILKSYMLTLNEETPTKTINFNKVLRHHVRYNGPASTDIQKGAIYVAILSSEATDTPTITYMSKTGYHDN